MSSSLHPNLVVCRNTKAHNLLFTKMRDKNTSSESFVRYSKRSMRLLAEDALAEFPSESVDVTTPCGAFRGVEGPDPKTICAVSIVRSGDALLECVRDLEPAIRVGKVLLQRDENHPQKLPKLFYSKLPPLVDKMHLLLCDPMLATGGSAILCIETLMSEYNVDPAKIVFANMICAPEGLQRLAAKFPQVKIVTVVVDEKLNNSKFIVPGLGDYGDRFFNT